MYVLFKILYTYVTESRSRLSRNVKSHVNNQRSVVLQIKTFDFHLRLTHDISVMTCGTSDSSEVGLYLDNSWTYKIMYYVVSLLTVGFRCISLLSFLVVVY